VTEDALWFAAVEWAEGSVMGKVRTDTTLKARRNLTMLRARAIRHGTIDKIESWEFAPQARQWMIEGIESARVDAVMLNEVTKRPVFVFSTSQPCDWTIPLDQCREPGGEW
jgi:hypothetical protein